MVSHGFVMICLKQVNIVGAYELLITASSEIAGEKLELCGQSSDSESGFLTLIFVIGIVIGVATAGSFWIVECLGYVRFTPASNLDRSAAVDGPLSSPGGIVSLDVVGLVLDAGGGVVITGAGVSGGGDAIDRTGGLGLLVFDSGSCVVSGRAPHCRSGSIIL